MAVTNSCGQTITQYNVQTGAAGNNLNNVAPSATSGVPLISQGAAADPAFGTAVVAGGGTGNTTFTAYSVIAAGTTATGAFQNVSGVGTAGQVLTSNGAAALPTWQSTSSPTPSTNILFYEEFIGAISAISTSITSDKTWAQNANNWISTTVAASAAHPGILGNNSITGAISLIAATGNILGKSIVLGGGALTIVWVFYIHVLSNVTNRYVYSIGMHDTLTGSTNSNGVYFNYSDNINSGNWQIIATSGGVSTTTNTATAVTTGWHSCSIVVNAAATSVEYFMDGVSQGTIATANIPTTNPIGPAVKANITAGNMAANDFRLDLCYLTQTLTTARY